MKYSVSYIVSIVLVNIMFKHTGPLFGALCVGGVFVLRDYAQREIGHWVFLLMTCACAISFFMASPVIAKASATAFAVSEIVDWLVFSTVKRDFAIRVLWSSTFGVLVDSFIFLKMIDELTWQAVFVMWLSKMVVAGAVWFRGRPRKVHA